MTMHKLVLAILLPFLVFGCAFAQHESTAKVRQQTRHCQGGSCRVSWSSGSGCLVRVCADGGLVVTAKHVVPGNGKVTVLFANTSKWLTAEILLCHPRADAAVLLVRGLKTIEPTPFEKEVPKVGDRVHTEGYPRMRLVTAWMNVSGFETWSRYQTMVRFDKEAIGGHSGGPVRSESGRFITVVTNKSSGCCFGPHPKHFWWLFHQEKVKQVANEKPKTAEKPETAETLEYVYTTEEGEEDCTDEACFRRRFHKKHHGYKPDGGPNGGHGYRMDPGEFAPGPEIPPDFDNGKREEPKSEPPTIEQIVEQVLKRLPPQITVEQVLKRLPSQITVEDVIKELPPALTMDDVLARVPTKDQVRNALKKLPKPPKVDDILANLPNPITVDDVIAKLPPPISIDDILSKLPAPPRPVTADDVIAQIPPIIHITKVGDRGYQVQGRYLDGRKATEEDIKRREGAVFNYGLTSQAGVGAAD
jgi:hypothetical protein